MTSDPIVVGTDGSATAQLAVDRAADLAKALGTEVHVVNSYATSSAGPWMAAAGGLALAELPSAAECQASAEKIVTHVKEQLRHRGIGVRTHVTDGEPADALITIAADTHAQMIVVGNRGMAGARRVLGSVPNRLSHRASCDVLIVQTC